jgi:hypothetical protein
MLDSDFPAYVAIGASLAVSLIQICRWLLHANPRALLNAGKWSIAGLLGATPALLLWLVMSGRSTLALTLAAASLPVLLRVAPQWRVLFASLIPPGARFPHWDHDFSAPGAPIRPEQLDPELVRRSVIVLTSYLEVAAAQGGTTSARMHSAGRLLNGPIAAGRERMSIEEALDILGLEAAAGPGQIRAAHHRLLQKLKPELGDTHYLIAKIDEAMEVLILGVRNRESETEVYDGRV